MPVPRPHMHTDARTALGPHSTAGPEVTGRGWAGGARGEARLLPDFPRGTWIGFLQHRTRTRSPLSTRTLPAVILGHCPGAHFPDWRPHVWGPAVGQRVAVTRIAHKHGGPPELARCPDVLHSEWGTAST